MRKSRVNANRYGLLLSLLLSTLLWGCQRDNVSGPITYILPWPDQNGEYHLTEVELTSLRHADRMEGSAARVFVKSGIKDGKFQGEVARPRLIKKGKRKFLAADYESALAIAVYAHYERFMEWDQELGIASDLSWPRQVGIQMHMRSKKGDREHNNARYVAKWDLTLVAPTSIGGLPLELNGGILAHEHFHAHFHARLVNYLQKNWSQATKSKEDDPTRDANVYLIRSWNEGLADFWGYLYTRDPQFMKKTFMQKYHVRQLDEGPSTIPGIKEFKSRVGGKAKGACKKASCQIYRVGTRLARVLKQVLDSQITHDEEKTESHENQIALRIMSTLPALTKRVMAEPADKVMSPDLFFEMAFPEKEPLPAWACLPLEKNLEKKAWVKFAERCGEREDSP